MKTVALFGFSANPPTGEGGHVGIVTWLLQAPLPELDGDVVDEVWALPVFAHRFTEKRDMPSFEHRFAMAQLAFRGLDRVRVLDTERRVAAACPEPGTIDLVRHLEAEHPGVRLVLVVGQDAHRDLLDGRWKEGAALQQAVRIVVIRRPGWGAGAGHEVPGLAPISSTEIRAAADPAALRAVPEPVADYIIRHRLYGFEPPPSTGG